jgi:hypothetical protein
MVYRVALTQLGWGRAYLYPGDRWQYDCQEAVVYPTRAEAAEAAERMYHAAPTRKMAMRISIEESEW